MKRTVIGAAVLALGISTVGVASADKPGDTDTTKTSYDTSTRDCGDGNTVTLAGPDTLWPPNHKMVDQTITATDGPSDTLENPDNQTALTVTPDVSDVVGGDGNTETDWSGEFAGAGDPSAVVDFALRAERSGKGEGRTYILDWVASFDGAAGAATPCASSREEDDDPNNDPFTIFVPHDQGKGNDA